MLVTVLPPKAARESELIDDPWSYPHDALRLPEHPARRGEHSLTSAALRNRVFLPRPPCVTGARTLNFDGRPA